MKNWAIVLMACCALSTPLFAMSRPNQNVVVTGYIKCYGNEPFTWPGITCDDGKVYVLKANNAVQKELLGKQDVHIKIEGTLNKSKDGIHHLKDETIEVINYSVVE